MSGALAGAWAAEVGMIAVRDLATKKRPPLPSELLASFAVYGALSIVAIPAPRAAVAVGWGLVVATLLASQIDVFGPLGDFMSGKTGAKKNGGTANLPSDGPGLGLGGPTPRGNLGNI